jgi:site-specific recombinase XerD
LSVRKQKDRWGRTNVVVDRRWPDGPRFRRLFPTRRLAEEVDARIKAAICRGSWKELREELVRGQEAKKVTLAEFSERYIEDYCRLKNRAWVRKRDSMRALCPLFGEKPLEDIRPSDLDQYFKLRKKAGISDTTLNRDLAHLKHLMNFAIKRGVIKENPISLVEKFKEERRMHRRPTEAELERFLNSAQPRVRPLFGFIRETGCRLSESLRVQHAHINRDQHFVIFTDGTKSGKFRVVALTDEALRWIDEMPVHPTCSYVFWNAKTGRRWKNVRKPIDAAIKASGLDWFHIKDLRRHYGIRLAEGGAEMHVIQAMLGHSSVKTTEEYYAHFSPDYAARRALQVLQGGIGKEKAGENGRQTGGTPEASKCA